MNSSFGGIQDIDNLVKTTTELVKLKSINPPGLEEIVANYLLNFFKINNVQTEIYPIDKNRFNVIAKIIGKENCSPLVFSGHMDVVPVSEKELLRWNTEPFSGLVEGGFIHGRGSTDMKGGLACVMCAMQKIIELNILSPHDIYLIATVDEEDSMKGSKILLNESLIEKFPMIIICEPTSNKVCIAGKGRTYGKIKINGKSGHGSQTNGHNVIDFARILMNNIAETTFPDYENTIYGKSFWQILSINAGAEPCVIPDELILTLDARIVPSQKTEEIWKKLDEILIQLQHSMPDYTVNTEIIDKREAWVLNSNAPILGKLKTIYETLKLPFETTYFSGTTDGSIFKRKGSDCIILGPGDLSCAHRENEKISIQELTDCAKIYFELMKGSYCL